MVLYIYMECNGIYIINLYKIVVKLEEVNEVFKKIVFSGRKVFFVVIKKQVKDIVVEKVKNVNMFYIIERWLGGMLINFVIICKVVKKMVFIDRMK